MIIYQQIIYKMQYITSYLEAKVFEKYEGSNYSINIVYDSDYCDEILNYMNNSSKSKPILKYYGKLILVFDSSFEREFFKSDKSMAYRYDFKNFIKHLYTNAEIEYTGFEINELELYNANVFIYMY